MIRPPLSQPWIRPWFLGETTNKPTYPTSMFIVIWTMKEFSETAVSWSLTSLFSTSVVIPETKSQGGKLSVPRKGRPAILTSTLATFLCSHPKREGDREAHYYASAYTSYNRGRSHRKTKLNQILQKQSCILN